VRAASASRRLRSMTRVPPDPRVDMNLSPEGKLITALAVQDMTEDQERTARELIPQARRQFDWPLFADQAAQHRVAPLISRQLRRLQEVDQALRIDRSVASTLHALEFYHAYRNTITLAELDAVLDAADEASLPVLPRKGGHLAKVAYREPGLRPMGDLDLLVAPDHVDPFIAVLERLGYKQGESTRRQGAAAGTAGTDFLPAVRQRSAALRQDHRQWCRRFRAIDRHRRQHRIGPAR